MNEVNEIFEKFPIINTIAIIGSLFTSTFVYVKISSVEKFHR